MEPLVTVSGVAAPLFELNISTDALIPSREITSASRAGYGPKLFAGWRYQPDGSENPGFVLNQPAYRESRILVTGANFGCGSSREMAVWALHQFGIRCVIAPSFAPIFRENCLRNGLLPVVLPGPLVTALAAQASKAPYGWQVDLGDCSVTTPGGSRHAFEFDPREREQLMLGLDPIAITLQRAGQIAEFVNSDHRRRPWIWLAATQLVHGTRKNEESQSDGLA